MPPKKKTPKVEDVAPQNGSLQLDNDKLTAINNVLAAEITKLNRKHIALKDRHSKLLSDHQQLRLRLRIKK